MTDIELESLIASLPAKTLDEIGVLASDAFVGHGMRDDGDSLVLLHGIVVYALRELAPLRALREAALATFEAIACQLDEDATWPVPLDTVQSWYVTLEDGILACDEASAPTET